MGRSSAFVVAAVLVLASAVARADDTNVAFDAEVPGLAGRAWIELLRQLVPDLKVDPAGGDHNAKGSLDKPIRLMAGDTEAGGDKSAIDLTSLDAVRIDIDGRPRWLVLGEQDGFGPAPLMLFEAEGEGKLLDAVDVVADMHTSMDSAGPLALGGGASVIGIRNWHDNSGQSFDDLKLVLIAKDRFSLIQDSGAQGERDAKVQTSEGLTFTVRPDPGRPLARIDVVLEHRKQRLAGDFETKVGKEVVTLTRTTFRWNAAKGKYERRER